MPDMKASTSSLFLVCWKLRLYWLFQVPIVPNSHHRYARYAFWNQKPQVSVLGGGLVTKFGGQERGKLIYVIYIYIHTHHTYITDDIYTYIYICTYAYICKYTYIDVLEGAKQVVGLLMAQYLLYLHKLRSLCLKEISSFLQISKIPFQKQSSYPAVPGLSPLVPGSPGMMELRADLRRPQKGLGSYNAHSRGQNTIPI